MVNTITSELLKFKRNFGWIMIILFPIIIVFTVGLAISPDVHNVPIALKGESALMNTLEDALDKNQFAIVHPSDLEEGFRRGNVRVAVIGENLSGVLYFHVHLDASEQSIKQQSRYSLEATIRSVYAKYILEIEFIEKYGGKSTFAYFAPGVLALAIFMGGLFGASETILSEREQGTLDHVITSPTSPTRFIMEKIFAYVITMGAGSVLTAVLILFLGTNIPDLFTSILLILISQLAFVSLGVMVSALVPNSQVIGEVNAVIMFPIMFFSGTFFSLYMMDPLIQNLSIMNPLRHLNEVWKTLLLKNGTFEDAIFPLVILIIYAAIFTIIGIGLMWRLTKGMQE